MKFPTFLSFLMAFIAFTSALFAKNEKCGKGNQQIAVEQLSLEEKVGQLLMVHFRGEIANSDATTLINELKVGGIIYYKWSNILSSPKQTATLSNDLQKLTKKNEHPVPLLIATDQEGGLVARLTDGFTIFPGNGALGAAGDPNLAESSALAMGNEMRAVGINMNLAPVVDVNTNPRNPSIGIRSFGNTPELVIAFGEKALEGYAKADVIATLKHFPGYGDASQDAHESLPRVNKSMEELEKIELLPYAKLASIVDVIMTGHILVPAFDSDHCATLSKKTISYLREKIGFHGVVITDSLVMGGVLEDCGSVEEAAIQACNAGCDILLLGGHALLGNTRYELTVSDVKRIQQALINAVKTGRITEDRLNESVERIFRLKEAYLGESVIVSENETDLSRIVNTEENAKIAAIIAKKAIRVEARDESFSSEFSADHNRKIVIAPEVIKEALSKTKLFKDVEGVGQKERFKTLFFSDLNPSEKDCKVVLKECQEADIVLFFSYNGWKNKKQLELIDNLLKMEKSTCLIAVRDPIDGSLFQKTSCAITTFSPTEPSLQAAVEQLLID